MSVTFTGSSIQWIGSQAGNHGLADVYLDGVLQATVDCSGNAEQVVLFQKSGLSSGSHTLKIVVDGRHSPGSSDNFVSIDAINVPSATTLTPTYPVVPQQPGTAITLDGRDSHIIVANYRLGDSQLQYSTSEIMTVTRIAGRDIAVLYGDPGSDGETVLRYKTRPDVRVSGGALTTTWKRDGDLRLNYTHTGLVRVQIAEPGRRPLLLLIADKPTAETFWRVDTPSGPVIVRGTHLVRTASFGDGGHTAMLSGDNGTNPDIEVFTSAARVTWNGHMVTTRLSPTGSLSGRIPVAAPVQLPALTHWRHTEESPEAALAFNDSSWQLADKTTTNSITPVQTLPILYADDYGFHTGNVWYRGHFQATGSETGIHLVSDSGGSADTSGGAQAFSAWLNGVFLGSSTTGSADFAFPAGALRQGADNVISVLTVNMGHEEDYNSTNANKTARGLAAAALIGASTPVSWRIQGNRGGENIQDPVRGPLAYGGLFGEREGWDLPGYPTRGWSPVALPTSDTRAGISWYRTDVTLHLPVRQDTSIGLTFSDNPARRYRALIFVNGWQFGNYVNYLGPQHSFPIPNGILNPHGHNTIAIAVWNLDSTTGGLGTVSLTDYGSWTSSLRVGMVNSPGYRGRR
jgi:beta-galactosidase GanA